MILTLAQREDPHYTEVAARLDEMHAEHVNIDLRQFPVTKRFSIQRHCQDRALCFILDEASDLCMQRISVVWNRRRSTPALGPHITESVRRYVIGESKAILDVMPHFTQAEWMNHPTADAAAELKAFQLATAVELGFEIPRTFMGNDPVCAARFIHEFPRVAVKTVDSPSYLSRAHYDDAGFAEEDMIFFTSIVESRDLSPLLPRIANCPTILQEPIQKEYELRITVIGNDVFACRIDSQSTERTKDDWRRYDLERTPHLGIVLPEEVQLRCRALLARLGLSYGAIDMIVTPDGRYVFLEINPKGQWLWIERLTGLPIAAAIASHLVHRVAPERLAVV